MGPFEAIFRSTDYLLGCKSNIKHREEFMSTRGNYIPSITEMGLQKPARVTCICLPGTQDALNSPGVTMAGRRME